MALQVIAWQKQIVQAARQGNDKEVKRLQDLIDQYHADRKKNLKMKNK